MREIQNVFAIPALKLSHIFCLSRTLQCSLRAQEVYFPLELALQTSCLGRHFTTYPFLGGYSKLAIRTRHAVGTNQQHWDSPRCGILILQGELVEPKSSLLRWMTGYLHIPTAVTEQRWLAPNSSSLASSECLLATEPEPNAWIVRAYGNLGIQSDCTSEMMSTGNVPQSLNILPAPTSD